MNNVGQYPSPPPSPHDIPLPQEPPCILVGKWHLSSRVWFLPYWNPSRFRIGTSNRFSSGDIRAWIASRSPLLPDRRPSVRAMGQSMDIRRISRESLLQNHGWHRCQSKSEWLLSPRPSLPSPFVADLWRQGSICRTARATGASAMLSHRLGLTPDH